MKQISDCLPAWLVCEVSRAAAALESAAQIGGEMARRENTTTSPNARSREGSPARNGMGKEAEAGKAPASRTGEVVNTQGETTLCKVQKLDTPNTMLGSITVAHRRRKNEVIPTSGAAVIDLGMEREKRHARSLSRAEALDLRPLAR